MTPREVLLGHTSLELTEWVAYFKVKNEQTERRAVERDTKRKAEQPSKARRRF